MKNLLLLIMCFYFASLSAQKNFNAGSIELLPSSELLIEGSTNINRFKFLFDIEPLCSPQQFHFSQGEDFIIFKDLRLQLLTKTFDCGNKRMNSDFQDLLKYEQHPEIIIELNRVELSFKEYAKAYIRVNLAGKSKHYSLPVAVINDQFQGKFKMNIRDFGLEPPKKALGLIEVDEMIEVQFNLKVKE